MIFIKLGYNTKLKLCKPLKFQSVVHNCLLRGRTEERDGMVREKKRWQDDTYESNDIGSAFKNPCKHFQLKNCPAICQLQFPRFAFSFSTFYFLLWLSPFFFVWYHQLLINHNHNHETTSSLPRIHICLNAAVVQWLSNCFFGERKMRKIRTWCLIFH